MHTSNWNRIKDGNKLGLQALYDEFFDSMYRFGLFFHKNEYEVQDAIQEIFLRIWERRETITIPQNSKNYLFTALRNELYQQHKKSSKINLVEEIDDRQVEKENVEEDDYKALQKIEVDKALRLLTKKNKEVIYLKYTCNLSNEEIAEVLGINYQSVRNLLHRSIKKLKSLITK